AGLEAELNRLRQIELRKNLVANIQPARAAWRNHLAGIDQGCHESDISTDVGRGRARSDGGPQTSRRQSRCGSRSNPPVVNQLLKAFSPKNDHVRFCALGKLVSDRVRTGAFRCAVSGFHFDARTPFKFGQHVSIDSSKTTRGYHFERPSTVP